VVSKESFSMACCWTVVTVRALTSQEGASLKYSHAALLSLEEDMARKGLALNLMLFYVKDIKGSRDFYVKKLGFKKTYGDNDYVSVKASNGITIGLHNASKKTVKPSDSEYYFRVDDVDVWYDRLRNKGVTFSQRPKDQPWGDRTAYFKDPDGYQLALRGPLASKK